MTKPQPSKPGTSVLFAASNTLSWKDPLIWLRLGFQDYKRSPRLSAYYGGLFAVLGLLLTLVLVLFNNKMFVLSLFMLFMLLGPLLAIGLYDIARQLERGQEPTLTHTISQIKKSAPNQWLFAVVMVIVALLWMRAATIVHVFYPQEADPSVDALLTFFMIGGGASALFSGLVFGISAFSLPMMMDRNTDAIFASISSLSAVMSNLWVSILWAGLIFLLIALGFATFYLGLIVVLPVIGYATWHGYKATLR